MTDLTVRPTTKFIRAGAILAVLVIVAIEIGFLVSWNAATGTAWLMLAPPILLAWPAVRMLRRRFTTTTIAGDRLRHETGIASKTTRNIQLSKIQDVRVDQGLVQRIFNIGDLSIETAGEASRLMVHNVDSPQSLADEIMNRAQRGAAQV